MATWRVLIRGVAGSGIGGTAAFLLFPAAGAVGIAAGAVTGAVFGQAIPFEKLLGLLASTTVYIGKTVIITVPFEVLKLCASAVIVAAGLLGQGTLIAVSAACSGLINGVSAAAGVATALGSGVVSVGSAVASTLGNGAAVASRVAIEGATSAMRGLWSGLKSLIGAFGKGGAFSAGALATMGALGAAVYKWGWPAIREAVIDWVKTQAVAYAPYVAAALTVLAIGYVVHRYVYAEKSQGEAMEVNRDEDQPRLTIVVDWESRQVGVSPNKS